MIKKISLWVMAAAYFSAGVHELIAPEVYRATVPAWAPSPAQTIVALGIVKIVLALGLLVPQLRRPAALGLVALLIALFPANLYLAWTGAPGFGVPAWMLWVRVPLQFVFMAWAYWHARPDSDARSVRSAAGNPPAILITGASSGLGRACALRLDSRGWHVFAGVRKPADADRLRELASARLTPISIDVTDPESVRDAASTIERTVGPAGLQGLVNNAGVCIPGPIELLSRDSFRAQLDVNLVGTWAVTRAFLPLLRRGGGRIVHVGSTGGRVALPFMGAYAASKFGLEGLTDAMRRELAPARIAVSLIEPGSIDTPIWSKVDRTADELLAMSSADQRGLYEEQLRATLRTYHEAMQARGTSPADVADAVEHALTSRRPKTRYPVGLDAQLTSSVVTHLPDRLVDWVVLRALTVFARSGRAGLSRTGETHGVAAD